MQVLIHCPVTYVTVPIANLRWKPAKTAKAKVKLRGKTALWGSRRRKRTAIPKKRAETSVSYCKWPVLSPSYLFGELIRAGATEVLQSRDWSLQRGRKIGVETTPSCPWTRSSGTRLLLQHSMETKARGRETETCWCCPGLLSESMDGPSTRSFLFVLLGCACVHVIVRPFKGDPYHTTDAHLVKEFL